MAECALENSGYIFLWEIENYNMHALRKKCCFRSPTFVTSKLNKSQWRFKLYPFETLEDNLGLEIEMVDGMSETHVEVSFYLLTSKGPKLLMKVEERKFVTKDTFIFYIEKKTLESIFSDNSVYFANSTLKLKCHLKSNTEPLLPLVVCSALTRFEVENHIFDHSFSYMNICPVYLYEKDILPTSKTLPRIKMLINKDPRLFTDYYSEDQNDRHLPSVSFEIISIADKNNYYKLKIIFSLFDDKSKLLNAESQTMLYPKKKIIHFLTERKHLDTSSGKTLTMHFDLSLSCSKYYSIINECNVSSNLDSITVDKLTKKEISYPEKVEMIPIKAKLLKPSQVGFDSLINDLSSLLTEKKYCDVTLKIDEKEFLAHKAILSTRSSVFDKMFKTNMKEKETGLVNIDDIDPQTFELFLNYLYLGRVDGLVTEKNVMSLYSAADKYQVLSLKSECSSFILDHLCAENVCDILILSDSHQDEELRNAAQEVFCIYFKTILPSKDWAVLLKEKPELAVETLQKMALNTQ